MLRKYFFAANFHTQFNILYVCTNQNYTIVFSIDSVETDYLISFVVIK